MSRETTGRSRPAPRGATRDRVQDEIDPQIRIATPDGDYWIAVNFPSGPASRRSSAPFDATDKRADRDGKSHVV
ncbi:MAG: hypothetical protein WBX25_36665 [Rhodomicrobium sp.]